jgi:hypothetical protein
MTSSYISYNLGGRFKAGKITDQVYICKGKNPFDGWKAFARDEEKGNYVQVFEVGPTEWVQGEPQAWSHGNFSTKEDAHKYASKAYHYINKHLKKVA